MYKVLILMFFSFQVVASDIFLTWDIPTGREDGSTIQTIDRFNIYQTFNNGGTVIVEIDPASNSHQISNVEAGIYTFQISTVCNLTNKFIHQNKFELVRSISYCCFWTFVLE